MTTEDQMAIQSLSDLVDDLLDQLLIPAYDRKLVTARLKRLLEEGDDNGYDLTIGAALPLEYEARIFGLITSPDSSSEERKQRKDHFGLILARFRALRSSGRAALWAELIRRYPAPTVESVTPVVPHQLQPTDSDSSLTL